MNGDKKQQLTVIWDPVSIDADVYARIIEALGDIVRLEGGIGLVRIDDKGLFVPRRAAQPRVPAPGYAKGGAS